MIVSQREGEKKKSPPRLKTPLPPLRLGFF
jgi:hypothetical protein